MKNSKINSITWHHHLLTFISLAGFVFSLVLVYLSMRAVMDVGGYCASGGPYAIEVECPEGVPWKILLGVFGMMVFGFAYISFLPRGAFNFGYFFWTALFGALGWNFVDYTIQSYQEGAGSIAWLICAIFFMIMALGPLIIILLTSFKIDIFIQGKGASTGKLFLYFAYQLVAIALGIWAGMLVF